MEVGRLAIGDEVIASIDHAFRLRTSRIHTAGEVICAAVHELGRRWIVSAASHVPGHVSSKSYDRWGYMPEKRAAMETWNAFVSHLLENHSRKRDAV